MRGASVCPSSSQGARLMLLLTGNLTRTNLEWPPIARCSLFLTEKVMGK
jgi:hypothetical protein